MYFTVFKVCQYWKHHGLEVWHRHNGLPVDAVLKAARFGSC
jgi:hypothetical protein